MPLPTSEPWKVMLDTMTQARLLQNDFLNVVYTRDDIVNAAKNAGIDTYAAITSIFRLLFVILYPVAVFVIQWTYSIARKCYTKWIVQGGIKHACIVVYEWHKQRTQKQLVIEFVCITMALAVYALRRWIQKHKFVQRIQFYIKRKRHTIHKVRVRTSEVGFKKKNVSCCSFYSEKKRERKEGEVVFEIESSPMVTFPTFFPCFYFSHVFMFSSC